MQYLGRVLQLVVGLVTVPLIARTLGSDGFGVYSAALAYVGIFSSLTEFGLTNAATLRMSADSEHESDWLSALASLRTLVAIAVAIACLAAIPVVFDQPDVRLTSLVLVGTIIFAGAASLMSIFQARLRGAIPLVVSILQSALWLSTVVGLAVLDAGPVAVAAGYTGMLGLVALVQVQVARRVARVAWRGTRRRWNSLLRIAIPVGLANVFISIYYSIDSVLLIRLADSEEAGVYGAAYRFLTPLLFLPQAVVGALFPVMAASYPHDEPRVRRLVQRCADYMAIITLPILAVTLVLSGSIVEIVFGAGYARTASILPILMLSLVSIGYGTLAGFLAPILGLQWRLTVFAAVGALANVGLNLLLIPSYGAIGSAWATVATEVLTMALLLGTCLRALRLRLRLSVILRALIGAAVMTATMWALRPLGFLPAIAAGGLSYGGMVLAMRVVTADDLRALTRR